MHIIVSIVTSCKTRILNLYTVYAEMGKILHFGDLKIKIKF